MRKTFISVICLFIYFAIGSNAFAQSNYIVKKGDTLWEIAQDHSLNLKRIINSNTQILNPNIIFPGQLIVIPNNIGGPWNNTILNGEEGKLLELLNAKRVQLGLKPLNIDHSLSKAAKLKSIDMLENKYISHNSPTYGDPTQMAKNLQIPFRNLKESIGAGHGSADEIFLSWMNSAANKGNILNNQATTIGIGYAKGGLHGHYWTILIIE